ncbi:hypothetical protein [Actinomadura sp. WMMA1423]|uniref:hypothetical protein n=1 Tax=Actinomadura sp. WMMA1423 TaxID=2591108 RepID=UPI0011475207|nr:hypothetical protein [Actinomadura sp. WMMA1423]
MAEIGNGVTGAGCAHFLRRTSRRVLTTSGHSKEAILGVSGRWYKGDANGFMKSAVIPSDRLSITQYATFMKIIYVG